MTTGDEKRNVVELDYYVGAYGPTIRIDVRSLEALAHVRLFFEVLAHEREYEADLLGLEWVRSKNVGGLLARLSATEPPKALTRESGVDGLHSFIWAGSSSYWGRIVDLVEGLAKYGGAAHQYLTEEGVDDALVELCLFESGGSGRCRTLSAP